MIILTEGNLLKSDAEALVNTVNTVGVMGKGIALQFKKAFPENYELYAKACKKDKVVPGTMFVTKSTDLIDPKYIINFPTKKHWRGKSKIEYVEEGLNDLIKVVQDKHIKSIAIPPLGCGLGGLSWETVRLLIEGAFASLPDVDVFLYPPKGTPCAKSMPNRTAKPKMTPGRRSLLGVLSHYASMRFDPEFTLIETQKLCYFLQLAGQPLRLNFVKWFYGPYATNLKHVINSLDGHYLTGWGAGDERPLVKLQLVNSMQSKINDGLKKDQELSDRIERVLDLVEGFDSPYGLELLGTVHWVITQELECKVDPEKIFGSISNWTDRKSRMFQRSHIDLAIERLESKGWLQDCPI
ncbi:macro domain-containing protein [Maridesulfovibrio sp.]|uniref:type II toxin-antitoxin system antitoxin DNA ADP-ribosyl glycohydrolase DarG n=1 Tax=Maridesulfovibrio sp. TaxID=2795000 RepID=UPI0029CA5FF7|nr:macro domain-containing protein [Maridesulfovibrio sp.]